MCVCVCVPLWDVEHMLRGGFVEAPAIYGPQTAEDAEERAFATAVGARDQ